MTTTRTVILAAALTVAASPAALACGGFFCNNANPVDQSGERILFAVAGNSVTAHIQIQYQGAAEKFSWVLPLPSVPDSVTVGTDVLFDQLRAQTDPRFELAWKTVEGCSSGLACPYASAGGGDGGTSGTGGQQPPGVQIVLEGETGPFNFKALKADTGQVLYEWLNEHGYDQPETAPPLIEHYVAEGYIFVAIKLLKNKSAGDLQPLVVRYSAPNLACIPLRLTSIAAAPDMPVWTWVLARARAVPLNFFHVLLNPKAYDWLGCATPTGSGAGGGWYWGGGADCQKSYLTMVSNAVDSANGHAFVTEYAGSTAPMKGAVYGDGQFDYLDSFESQHDPVAFLQQLFGHGFPNTPLFREIVKEHIPKPENAGADCDEDAEFYNWNIETCIKQMPAGWVFDPAALVADLRLRIVEPMKDAQELFSLHPYMTRLVTTLSPDEMTKDPLFSFNPDLPDVSNVHSATATPICENGKPVAATVELPGGETITVPGTWSECGYFQPSDGGGTTGGGTGEVVPAAEIQILGEAGPPSTVAAGDVPSKEQEIDLLQPDPRASGRVQTPSAAGQPPVGGFSSPGGTGTGNGTGGSTGTGGSGGRASGCTTSSRSGGLPAGLLAFLLLLGVIRWGRRPTVG